MALVSIQILDGPDSIKISAAIEPGIEVDADPETLTPAQQLGGHLMEALRDWMEECEKAQAAKPIVPKLVVPGR